MLVTKREASLVACAAVVMAGCAHRNRVSRGALGRIERRGEPFVLVFGSMTTPGREPARPEMRFVYQTSRSSPEYLLASLAPASERRFYAILKPPAGAALDKAYLDHFYLEAGSQATGFDRILYVHVTKPERPVAMYLGEIRMVPARRRQAQGEKVAVAVRDDFINAAKELKRLYPGFDGTMDNEARLLPKKLPGEE